MKSPIEHHLEVLKTARWFELPAEGEQKSILIVIHGYRQLAENFIERFRPLCDQGITIIAPEGLHRFYVEGYSGKVGASWMTKEDRETDISDYVNYLNRLFSKLPETSAPIDLLGFSQGGPTACRWLAASDIPFRRLILHSTVFPNDFDFAGQKSRLNSIPVDTIFGDDDQFANEETIAQKIQWMKDHGIAPILHRFKGGHKIHLESVQSIILNA